MIALTANVPPVAASDSTLVYVTSSRPVKLKVPALATELLRLSPARPDKSSDNVSPGSLVGEPPVIPIAELACGRMSNVSASAPPVIVVFPSAVIEPSIVTVEPMPTSVVPPSTVIETVAPLSAADNVEPLSKMKSSPVASTMSSPVEVSVAPLTIRRSSPVAGESPTEISNSFTVVMSTATDSEPVVSRSSFVRSFVVPKLPFNVVEPVTANVNSAPPAVASTSSTAPRLKLPPTVNVAFASSVIAPVYVWWLVV